MDKQVTSTPQYLEMGGCGYLYLHYLPPVDWEPAINVDMVNFLRPRNLMTIQTFLKNPFCKEICIYFCIWYY